MSIYQDDDEIFMVPVPRSRLRAVYGVLGDPATGPKALAREEEMIEVQGQGPWTSSMTDRLEAATGGMPSGDELVSEIERFLRGAEAKAISKTANVAADRGYARGVDS